MKITCKNCGEFIDEKDIIKVSRWELRSIESCGASICGHSDEWNMDKFPEHICQECYKNPGRIYNSHSFPKGIK